jgi:hypothetical protein
MGYATLKLTNLFGHQSVEVSALVDTGATFMARSSLNRISPSAKQVRRD